MPFIQSLKHYFVPTPQNAYRPHLLHRSWLLAFLALVLGAEGFLVANLIARQTSETFLAAVVPADIIALTNAKRSMYNASLLTENKLLDKAAQAKAQDMARNQYFSHNGPDGTTPWEWVAQAGYKYEYAGENLAVRFINSSDVVNAWMASPSHKSNIIKPVYKEIGVGVAQGVFEGQPATYVVQYFAAPKAVVVSTETPATNQLAAAAEATAGKSFVDTISRQLLRTLGDPQTASNWVLGFSAAILLSVLFMTFVVRVQVQPHNMLMGGAVVAVFALGFLALNLQLVGGGMSTTPQTASVTASSETPPTAVLIDAQGASTGYALFP